MTIVSAAEATADIVLETVSTMRGCVAGLPVKRASLTPGEGRAEMP